MRIVVLDTETTGMGDADQVVEVATVSWPYARETPPREERWWSLVKPTCPVSLEARAVHHISDGDLEDQPTMEQLLQRRGIPGLLGAGNLEDDHDDSEVVCLAAHNLGFDWRMLVQSGVAEHRLSSRRICTWRCAQHLYPDAPGHSNQVLRYYLDLRVPLIKSLPPHRALPDAVVTAALLQKMLETETPDNLEALTKKPVMLKTVRFGKHKGTEWKNLDSGYLNWILSKDFDADAHHTARTVLEGRRQPLLRR